MRDAQSMRPSDRQLIVALLVILTAMASAAAWTLVQSPSVPAPSGYPHPHIAEMSVGGDGLARVGPLFVPSLLWQCFAILACALLILLGVSTRHRSPCFCAGLAISILAVLGAWCALMASYAAFLESGQTRYVLGFPAPSAWMLFGVWGGSLGLIVLYSVGYRSFVFTHEDEARFAALLDELRDRPGDGEV